MRKFLLFLPFCCLMATMAVAQPQMRGGIRGNVSDEISGDPVPFSQVILMYSADDALVQATVCDDKGNYFFGNVLPGTYAIFARSQGFAPLQITDIELPEGEWIDVSPVFGGESFETDTLKMTYKELLGNPKNTTTKPPKGTKKTNKSKPVKQTAYERRMARAAKKMD